MKKIRAITIDLLFTETLAVVMTYRIITFTKKCSIHLNVNERFSNPHQATLAHVICFGVTRVIGPESSPNPDAALVFHTGSGHGP